MKHIFLLMITLVLVGCAVSKTKLTTGGMSVKTISKKKAKKCDVVDKVQGTNKKGSKELAKNHVRNLVDKVGGNAIIVNDIIQNGGSIVLHATAYHCK